MSRGDSASLGSVLRSRRPQTRLDTPAREPGDLGDACASLQADGRRLRPCGPYARLRGVGQRHSTDESFEQRGNTLGGEWGGKAADQGEHPSASHAPDPERGTRVPGAGGCAESREGTPGDEVHRFAPPPHGRFAPRELLRAEAKSRPGMTWQEYETGLEGRLAHLHSRVHRGAYRALPSRRVYIPKGDGRQRRWGSRHWRIRSSSRLWSPSLTRFTKRTFWASRMAFDRGAARIRRWMRSRRRG